MQNRAVAVENPFRLENAMNILPEKSSLEKDLSFFNKEANHRPCWSCQSEVEDLYNCSHCTALQQFLKDTDYFTLFNLGYLLTIDLDALEKQYYELSRKFHPDYFLKTSKEEQAISLENTAHLTTAYRTLKAPKKRMTYLIQLAGQKSDTPAAAPAELFESILEIQEHLESLAASKGDEKAEWCAALEADLKEMAGHQDQARALLATLSSEWDDLENLRVDHSYSDQQRNCLEKMQEILSHDNYLDRIIEEISDALEGAE